MFSKDGVKKATIFLRYVINRYKKIKMKKKTIQSVSRAIKILDIVSSENKNSVRLKEIANRLGLGSSTVYYLINTLIDNNFIIQSGNKYNLGPKSLQLGTSYLENLSIYKIALPILEGLLVEINEIILLYMIENNEFLLLAKMESTHSVKPTNIIITPNNATATAIGKVLVSSLSKDELKIFIKKNGLKKFTKNTITSFEELCKELEKVKKVEFALDREESDIGVNCIATPIYNHNGKIVAALGISIPIQRYSEKLIGKLLPLLKNGTAKISRTLGFRQ